MSTGLSQLALLETEALRTQASGLLDRLISDQAFCEQRSLHAGRRDPMKFVTGRTALDGAISSTREMIQHIDTLLVELRAEVTSHETERFATAPHFGQRNGILVSDASL